MLMVEKSEESTQKCSSNLFETNTIDMVNNNDINTPCTTHMPAQPQPHTHSQTNAHDMANINVENNNETSRARQMSTDLHTLTNILTNTFK